MVSRLDVLAATVQVAIDHGLTADDLHHLAELLDLHTELASARLRAVALVDDLVHGLDDDETIGQALAALDDPDRLADLLDAIELAGYRLTDGPDGRTLR